MSRGTVSVLTLNIWNRENGWADRRAAIAALFSDLAPDLVALCEVKDAQQAGEVAPQSYNHHWAGSDISGVMVGSKWPLRPPEICWLKGDDDAPGGLALRAVADTPFGPISLTCATSFFYLSHHGFKRERHMPGLADFARGAGMTGHFPPILAGDFNADPESAEIRFLKGLQSLDGTSAYFCDAWDHGGGGGKGATWSNQNPNAAWAHWPDKRIDYIFVGHPRRDGAGKILSCRVVGDEPHDGIWASDHFGVFAQLDGGRP